MLFRSRLTNRRNDPPTSARSAIRVRTVGRSLLFTSIVTSISPPALPAAVQRDRIARIGASVDSLIRRQMARSKINGAAVVVMANGTVLKSAGYGTANLETGESVGPKTSFFIASITKAFTSATVLRLAEEGRFQLDDSIGAFVPGLPLRWRGSTVRDLLGMTSGIPGFTRVPGRGISWPDYQMAVDSTAEKPVAPRGMRVYGGADYELLGKLVESVANQPFADVVRAKIFEPLQLESAAFGDWRILRPGRAEWYSVFDPEKQDFSAKPYILRTDYPSYHWPGAGLFITAEDLATFVDALGRGRVLGPRMLEAYWRPVALADGTTSESMLGSWAADDSTTPGRPVFHEGGVRAAAVYERESTLVVVVLTNLQGGLPIEWIDQIRKLYRSVARS